MRRLAAFLTALLLAALAVLAPAGSSSATPPSEAHVEHNTLTQAASRPAHNSLAPTKLTSNTLTPSESSHDADTRQHTVLILTGGLRWDQLDHSRAPYLSRLAASGIAGNLVPISVRGATCPVDSWLAMSAGRKVSQRSMASSATCPQERVFGGTRIPEYPKVARAIAKQGRAARLGFLSEELHGAGIDVHPIGVGAAYALADPNGFIPFDYEPAPRLNSDLAEAVAESAAAHELTIVDADKESYATDAERIAAQVDLEQWVQAQEAAGLDPDDEDSGHMPADVVDGTELDPQRQQVAALNIVRLERILAALPVGTRVLVASIVGLDTTPYMQIVTAGTAAGPSPDTARISPSPLVPSLAFAESVRQPGIIQLADLDPTLLSWLGIDDLAPTGTALRAANPTANPCAATDACYTDRVAALIDKAKHAGQIQTLRGAFVRYWNWAAIAFFAASLFLLARPLYRTTLARRPAALAWSWIGLTISALPLASFLLNMWPWWAGTHPRLALLGGSWALAALLAAAAFATRRLHEAGPLLTVATLTALALGIDAATGSHVMADSPIGFNLLTGARFYGVGNEAYSLLAAGSLLAFAFVGVRIRDGASRTRAGGATGGAHAADGAERAGAVTGRDGAGPVAGGDGAGPVAGRDGAGDTAGVGLQAEGSGTTARTEAPGASDASVSHPVALPPRRAPLAPLRRRAGAVGAVGLAGGAIAAVDALPKLGADFGGVLSYVPALALLLLFLGQVRLTAARAAGIGTATIAIAVGVAVADWMRPPSARTHLGRFVQSVADGELLDVLGRKLATNLRLLTTTTYRWVVLAAVLLVALALLRALMRRPGPAAGSLAEAESAPPPLRNRPVGAPLAGHARRVARTLRYAWARLWGHLAPHDGDASSIGSRLPALRPALVAISVCFAFAFALNDSGIVLPGVAADLLVPGLVALVLEGQQRRASAASHAGENDAAQTIRYDVTR